jgi:glutamate racemase
LTLWGGVRHRLAAMVDPAAPILLFDSGVGGLTVLAELRKLLPAAPVIYAADTAGLPYGEKTEAEVAARVAGLLGRLSERYSPRLITIACNTASTIALGMVRDVLHVPIVGTVPAIKPAAAMTKTGVIGLLGTAATIRQGYVDRLQAEFAADKILIRHACPALVEAAEAKLRGGAPDPGVAEPAWRRADRYGGACLHALPARRGRTSRRARIGDCLRGRCRGDRPAHRLPHAGSAVSP